MSLTTNLVSYYDFQGDADDRKGSNNGTVTNATLTNGKVENGYSFNGSDAHIDINYHFTTANNGMTLSAWMYNTGIGGSWEAIMGTGASGDADWAIVVGTNGKLGNTIRGNNNDPAGSWIYSTTSIDDSAWHLVTITYDNSAGYIYLYVDGTLENSQEIDLNNAFDQDRDIYVGARNDQDTASEYFNGVIDEVGVWTEALAGSDITELYNSGKGKYYNTSTNDFEDSDLRDELVSYYKFSGNANDSLGLNDGTVDGATLTASGLIGSAYDYNGTDNKIDIDGSVLQNISGSVSVSAWFKGGTQGETYATLMQRGDWNAGAFGIRLKATALFEVNELTPNNADTGSDYSDNNWHHVVGTVDAAGSLISIYMDGSLSTQNAITNGSLGTDIGEDTTLGSRSVSDRWYDGIIDEVGIWNRALTSTEVTTLFNGGSGLTYPFIISGYSKGVCGITSYSKINGVAKANISKFNGV
tara:strand:+ start:1324 stop:2733 length:1410 start_codon:yes stop_codon:yes gene_type:complete